MNYVGDFKMLIHTFIKSFLILTISFCFIGNNQESKNESKQSEIIQKQLEEAINIYEKKKELFLTNVTEVFDKKEKNARDKVDLKLINSIKNERESFLKFGKEPSIFYITDQKRALEIAKLDLLKAYENSIKETIKLKLDHDAEKYSNDFSVLKREKLLQFMIKNDKDMKVDENKEKSEIKNIQKKLQAKLAGKTVFNPKTNEVTITYDFQNKNQLNDFELSGKPILSRGLIYISPSDKIIHKVNFKSLRVTGVYTFNNLQGLHVQTSNGSGFKFYVNGGIRNVELLGGERVIALGNNGSPKPNTPVEFKLSVSEEKVDLIIERTTVGASYKQKNAGQLILGGGNGGNSFGRILIQGVVSEDWMDSFLEPKE